MTISRIKYYFLVLAISFAPFLLYKIGWLLFSKSTIGVVVGTGETRSTGSGGGVGRQSYPIVSYTTGKGKLVAYGDYNLPYKEGDDYPLRYSTINEKSTRLNTFLGCWIDTLIWCTVAFVMVTISFLVEGIVPKNKLVKIYCWGFDFVDKPN